MICRRSAARPCEERSRRISAMALVMRTTSCSWSLELCGALASSAVASWSARRPSAALMVPPSKLMIRLFVMGNIDETMPRTETEDLLIECEAKANEAKAIANAAPPGPWRGYYQKEGRFMGNRVAVDSTHDDPDSWAQGVLGPIHTVFYVEDCEKSTIEFVAHARTSNPDLADRVVALVKMVRERDEHIRALLVDRREKLRQLMSDLSNEHWSASWLDGCEFELWHFVVNGPGHWGLLDIAQDQIEELRRLSDDVGGWFTWPDDDNVHGALFVPMSEWLAMYQKHTRAA
jgi:hypothetical protein